MIRLLLSAYACFPDWGTEPGFGWNWALHLARKGISVTVLTQVNNINGICRQLKDEKDGNLDLKFVGVNLRWTSSPYIHYLLWQRAALRKAKLLHLHKPFDIIQHVTFGSFHMGSWLWQLDSSPFILGPVGGGQTAPPELSAYFGREWWKEWVRSRITNLLRYSFWHKSMMRKSALVLATNKVTAKLAHDLGARRTELFLDTGLPEDFFVDALPHNRWGKNSLNVLWAGRIMPRKGLCLALDAISRVKIPICLTILGDGPQEPQISGWINERKLRNKVKWYGRVPWSKMKKAYLEHDVFLLTSLRESFGSQLIEAMATGLPIITLDLHGAQDWVPKEAGIKVPYGNPEQTANALAQALEGYADMSVSQKLAMSQAGYEFARLHTWPKKAERMIKLYEHILGL